MSRREKRAFLELLEEGLNNNGTFRLKVLGGSMQPAVSHGDIIEVKRLPASRIRPGDIILYRLEGKLVAHRLIRKKIIKRKTLFYTKGDMLFSFDSPVGEDDILGKVVAVEKRNLKLDIRKGQWPVVNRILAFLSSLLGIIYTISYKLVKIFFGQKGDAALLFFLRRLWILLSLSTTASLRLLYSLATFLSRKSLNADLRTAAFKRASRRLYEQPQQIEQYSRLVRQGLSLDEEEIIAKYCKPRARILDVGCGAGREALSLAGRGFSVVGTDISRPMASQARVNALDSKLRVRFLVADLVSLNFKDNSFEYVLLLSGLIELIPGRNNRLKALREARRVLKPNGLLILSLSSRDFYNYPFRYFLRRLILFSANSRRKLLLKILSAKKILKKILGGNYPGFEKRLLFAISYDYVHGITRRIDQSIGNSMGIFRRTLTKTLGKIFKGCDFTDEFYGRAVLDGKIRRACIHHYSQKEILADLAEAGLKVVEVNRERARDKNISCGDRHVSSDDFYVCGKT